MVDQTDSADNMTTTLAPAANHLVISVVDQEPFITREPRPSGDYYSGYLVDLINEISRRANFTYTFKQADEHGRYLSTGWTGIIGDVVKGEAQIGGGALTVTTKREEAVDFTKPYLSNSVNLLVQKPTWEDLGLGYLVRPFSADYWIMLLVVLLLIGIVFFVIGKFSPYEWGNVAADRDPRGAKNSFTLRNSYLFALSTITWQGFREAPHSLSGRIMAAFWWMFILFSLIAYTANLTAYFLARPEQIPKMPFKTYEDLLADTNIRVGVLLSGSTESLLRNSRSETLRSIYSKINAQNTFVGSYSEGAKRVKTSNGNFVMFMETDSAEYYARKNCNLMIYGDTIFPSNLAFAVRKGSVWKGIFNTIIEDLKDNGYLEQLKDKYWHFSGDCTNIDGRKYVETGGHLSSLPIYPITLKDMAVAILLLFLGFIAAMIFLVIEIVHYAVTKKGKKIERPKILKNPPKIFRPKTKAAKAGPTDVELGEEAGPSSDGLESVPLEDAEDPGAGSGDELRGDEAKA
ncbi:glutamate receptor 2-like isoform X1 [Biomphalaria glabrata]|uniref:Glutamate receptor 2-like isoform X1 n=1 Tax=Biomphalaria glabrata TaxID=6526 RepID=A0A9W3A3Y6_BIOGL|nr:glutamate receptor 2-like isoform X1 [Biomphalaria glabrata]